MENLSISPLHKAIEAGSIQAVQKLNVNGVYTMFTPLHNAIRNGNLQEVHALIQKRINLESKDTYGETPLHYAAMFGEETILEALLEKGAEIEGKNSRETDFLSTNNFLVITN